MLTHAHLNYTMSLSNTSIHKLINDKYGHLAGDSALKSFASIVKDTLRKDDLFGRYGGDEFVIVFPHATIGIAQKIVERINSSLEAVSLNVGDTDLTLSISVGLCELTDENSVDEMINNADKMIYQNKQSK